MAKDFIKISRKIKEWEWYDDPITKSVFLHLLLNANWKDGSYHGVEVKAGEVVFGRRKAAKALGISEMQVRTAIEHLKKTGEISTSKTTNRFSVIRIEKWSFFQGREFEGNQQLNQQITSKQPADNQQITTSKKGRREEGKNIYPPNPPEGACAEIISHLNQRIGTKYQSGTRETRKLIGKRMEEGFSVEDFKSVIDKKCVEWMGTDKQQFLRPQTLFGAKFESYLNAPVEQSTGNKFADAILRGDFDD